MLFKGCAAGAELCTNCDGGLRRLLGSTDSLDIK